MATCQRKGCENEATDTVVPPGMDKQVALCGICHDELRELAKRGEDVQRLYVDR
jgi:hypothetical protein